jgi:hypothetical protein
MQSTRSVAAGPEGSPESARQVEKGTVQVGQALLSAQSSALMHASDVAQAVTCGRHALHAHRS